MTPKEKANSLVERFYYACGLHTKSKECALACVDEILNTFNINWTWCSIDEKDKERWKNEFDFWKEVKQEIEKL